MTNGWKSSGISTSWTTTNDEIEGTLYEEAKALEAKGHCSWSKESDPKMLQLQDFLSKRTENESSKGYDLQDVEMMEDDGDELS